MNYYIQDFCCFCLSIANEKCSNKSSKHPDNLTPFDKIKTVLLELSAVMCSDSRICMTCRKNVDFIYEFNKTCLRNINILNSYKKVLQENKSKIKCDLFVNLDNSKQLKDTLVSEEVEIGSSGSPLTNNDTLCDANFISESHSSSVAEVNKEIQINYENCDEESERSWLDSEIKIEIEEIDLKREWTSEISDSFKEMNKSKQFNEKIVTSSDRIEVKIEPPESPLDNDDSSYDANYISQNYSSGAAEVKKEIEINNETCDEKSKRSLSDLEIKIEIEESDLKQEWMNEINDTAFNESLKSTYKDFEDFPVQSAEEVLVKEEENSELVEDLLEVSGSEKHSGEKLGHSESQVEKQSNSFQKKPIQVDDQEFELDRYELSHSKTESHTAHKCDNCGKLFKHKSTLKNHIMVIHAGEKPHKCDICGKLFKHNGSLINHMAVHTGEKPYGCDICGKLFKHNASLINHMAIHTGEKPYGCEICGKSFIQKRYLEPHMLIHTDEKPHKCDTCGKSFNRKTNLKSHTLIHTGERPHKCDTCGKSFTFKVTLRRHMLIHTGEKPHKCDTCGKFFTRKTDLQSHILIHKGDKTHKCDTCGKLFTLKKGLMRHILLHTDKKPHKCNTCGKSFCQKSYLESHKLIHTDEKPHKCDICGKLFINKHDLHRHILMHNGDKTHKCDTCGKFFTLKKHLKRHILIHTGKKPHKCDTGKKN